MKHVASTGTNYTHNIHAGQFDLVTDEPRRASKGRGSRGAQCGVVLISLQFTTVQRQCPDAVL